MPERSFGRKFTQLGRLENAWGAALAKPDPDDAIAALRKLYPRFGSVGQSTAPLWLPFQESVLDARFAGVLGPEDFDGLRDVGEQFAGTRAIGVGQTWWPLISCRLARRAPDDLESAHALLARLYYSPLAVEEDRVHAAAALATTGAVDDPALAAYADLVLRGAWVPPAVLAMVDAVLAVGFDADDGRLGRAYTLAERLSVARRTSAISYALGLGELLLHRRPQVAVGHLRNAFTGSGAGEEELHRALLSAYLHLRAYDAALAIDVRRLNARGVELVSLCRMLAWLDASATTSDGSPSAATPPETTARLAAIDQGGDVGPWRDYVVGRSFLLDGYADRARWLLAPLLAAGFVEPDTCYHVAWAHLLCQDVEGVRAAHRAVAGRPGEWALGCLLLDADPGADPGAGVEPAVHDGLRPVVLARRQLVEGRGPTQAVDWESSAPGATVQAERLEALRTALGAAFAQNSFDELGSLTRRPLFARLPAAEQWLWTGLAVRATNPDRCRELLERSHAAGRSRAALLLAADALEAGRPAAARESLQGLSGPKAELLSAWAQAQEGAREQAAVRLEPLSGRGLPQADYALGLLDLQEAAGQWASGLFDEAGTRAHRAVRRFASAGAGGFAESETARLAEAARALTEPAGPDPLPWQKSAAQPWTARLLGLAQLLRTPEKTDPLLARAFADWQHTTEPPVSAGALLRAGLLAQDASVSESAAAFLADLAGRDPSPESLRAAQRAAAHAAFRLRDEFPDAPDDPLLAVAGCGVELAGGDRTEAVRRLRALDSGGAVDDGDEDQRGTRPVGATVAGALADALEGIEAGPLEAEVPAAITAVLDVVYAAARAAKGDAQAAAESLLRALRNDEARGLIDLRTVLPLLCADAVKRGRRSENADVLVDIIRRAADAETGTDGLSVPELARCAMLVGDLDTAGRLWRRALDETADESEAHEQLSKEYSRFLCHRAVSAHLADDRDAALSRLRDARSHDPEIVGTVIEDLTSDERVSALLRHLFPESPMLEWQRFGRYPQLGAAVAASRRLQEALDADAHDQIIEAWAECTREHDRDDGLWHAVAVLCREDALARAAGRAGVTAALTTATALWALLAAGSAEAERMEVVEELLNDHKARMTQALARNDLETARAHARCLNAVGQGVQPTRALLAGGAFEAMAARIGADRGFEAVARSSQDLLEKWGAERLTAAELLLTDKAGVQKLPPGIDRDYESAIKELEVVLTLGIGLKNVLCTAVAWHNNWLNCMYQMGRGDSMKPVVASSGRYADVLAAQCTPGRPHLRENQELGEYFVFMGFHLIDTAPVRSIGYLETARSWDSNNISAPGLIKSAQRRIEDQTLDKGTAALDRGDFDQAERLLSGSARGREMLVLALVTKALVTSTEAIKRLTAQEKRQNGRSTSPQRAAFLAANSEAMRILTRAQRLDPGNELVREHLTSVRGLPARMRIR